MYTALELQYTTVSESVSGACLDVLLQSQLELESQSQSKLQLKLQLRWLPQVARSNI